MLEVNLKQYNSVKIALERLPEEIKLAKRNSTDRLLKIITGKGSKSGTTHKIKTEILKKLYEYKKQNFIKDYLDGTNYIFGKDECMAFTGVKALNFAPCDVGNGGIIIVFV